MDFVGRQLHEINYPWFYIKNYSRTAYKKQYNQKIIQLNTSTFNRGARSYYSLQYGLKLNVKLQNSRKKVQNDLAPY